MRHWIQSLAASVLLAALVSAKAFALAPTAIITGNLSNILGAAASNIPVTFSTLNTGAQNINASPACQSNSVVIPDIQTFYTDSFGNLPSGITLPQCAFVDVIINRGQPQRIQIPVNTTADIDTLLLAVTDPPSLISSIQCTGCSSVINPPLGTIGTATITVNAGMGFPLTGNASASGFLIQQLGQPATNGDALEWGGNASLNNLTINGTLTLNGTLDIPGTLAVGSLVPYTLTGSQSLGAFNGARSGEKNIADFGVLSGGSTTTGTGSINGTTAALSLDAAHDFSNGQWVLVPGAGATNSEAAPSPAPTVTAVSQDWIGNFVVPDGFIIQPLQNNAGAHWYEPVKPSDWQASHSYALNALILPTSNNAGGYTYQITACSGGCPQSSGSSRPSFTQTVNGTITDGSVTWTNVGVNDGTTTGLINCTLAGVTVNTGTATALINSPSGCTGLTSANAVISRVQNNSSDDTTGSTITVSGSPPTTFTYTQSGASQAGVGGLVNQYPITWPQGADGSTVSDGTVTWTKCDSTCTQTYLYKTAFENDACGESIASSASSSVTNANPLDGVHNYNIVGTTPDATAESVVVYVNAGGAGYALSGAEISSVDSVHTTVNYHDIGRATLSETLPCISSTPPASAINDALSAKILSGGGTTTLTLSQTAAHSVSGATVYHDDAPIVNLTIPAAQALGLSTYCPAGTYAQASPILIGDQSGNITQGVALTGSGQGSCIWKAQPSMAALPQVLLTECNTCSVREMTLTGATTSGAIPIANIESRHVPAQPNQPRTGDNQFLNDFLGSVTPGSLAITEWDGIAYVSHGNNENNNDYNQIIGGQVNGFANAGHYIGHRNALAEIDAGVSFLGLNGIAGIQFNGGNVAATGIGIQTNATYGFAIDERAGQYLHDIEIIPLTGESGQGLIRSSVNAVTGNVTNQTTIQIDGATLGQGQFPIIWNSPLGLNIHGGGLPSGTLGEVAQFNGPSHITGSHTGISLYQFNGDFTFVNNVLDISTSIMQAVGSGSAYGGLIQQLSGNLAQNLSQGLLNITGYGYPANTLGTIFNMPNGSSLIVEQGGADAYFVDGSLNLKTQNHSVGPVAAPIAPNYAVGANQNVGAILVSTGGSNFGTTLPSATFADGTHCGASGSIDSHSTTEHIVVTMGSTNPTTVCPISFGTNAQCPTGATCEEQFQSGSTNANQVLQVTPSVSGVTLTAATDMHGDTFALHCDCW
jgi:hypothetical protein